jgi:hypothetical protein
MRQLKYHKVFLFIYYSVSQPKCRVRDEAPTLGPGGDNVLLRQRYRTPHGAVIDDYGAMVE